MLVARPGWIPFTENLQDSRHNLFDVYVGFFFFIGWIWYRDCCLGMTLIWAIAICVGGNVVAGIYAIIALYKSEGDPTVFFMGDGKRCCSPKEKEA